MANSYLNIVSFLFTTLFYYLAIKPNLTYDDIIDQNKYEKYKSKNYMYLAIYLLLVIIIQFIVNASIITSTCGGNITDNLGAAGVFTFIPWTLIFGAIILALSVYPGFKTAFSDVVGYFYVSSSANKLLTELLIDKNIQQKIDNDSKLTPEQKQNMQNAADAIIKICGNTSILINQIVPNNFNDYWNILKPLMKEKFHVESSELLEKKKDLFEIVVTRDNVGEAMWYIYTGLFITSWVKLQISQKKCSQSVTTMEENQAKFEEAQQKAREKQAKLESTVYTL
jgi:hypothetical protein